MVETLNGAWAGGEASATKRIVLRLLETFFRRWWAYLLPVVLFTAVGVSQNLRVTNGYKSVGVINVSGDTLLSNLTSIRGEGVFGYETPAAFTSRQMNSLLRTELFINAVAEAAGVTTAVEQGLITSLYLRQSIWASADGDSLIQVVAVTNDPDLSARLARGTIESYLDYVVQVDVAQSNTAVAFYTALLEVYQRDLDSATEALKEYAEEHPGPQADLRPLEEQVQINALTANVQSALGRVQTAQDKSEEARLFLQQATSDVTERLRLVDEPQVPFAPEPRLKQLVLTIGMFAIVGLMLSCGAVVLGALADRSMHTSDDVESRIGIPVAAVFPDARV
jgi:hypothetical protein